MHLGKGVRMMNVIGVGARLFVDHQPKRERRNYSFLFIFTLLTTSGQPNPAESRYVIGSQEMDINYA